MALPYRFDLTGDGRVESVSPPAPPMPQQKSRNLILVLVTLALIIGFGPTTAFASAPPQSATVPRAAAGPSGPQREVFGFALASSLSDPTVGYPSWDFSLLTTVAFFGLHVNSGDGHFATDSGWNVFNSAALPALVSAAHSHGAKVVVTIVLQDFAAGTPQMCAGLTHAATTVADTVTEIKAKGLDGVNVDYEGLNGSCGTADPSWARHAFTNLVGSLRAATSGYYLTVDTYASSAVDPYGFFDVKGLAASTDAFFVMAYDLEYSNWARSPTNCSRFCLGPTSPLGSYYYNDASVTSQYTAAVPASKVILGVPYYGRKACVASATPNAYPASGVVADTYLDASQEYTSSLVKAGSYVIHRDTHDTVGQERWDTWINTSLNCIRELYWDDTVSLGHKYALVNGAGLRGVGMWNLNYGGGAPELWSLLNTYFSCTVAVNLAATVTTTAFSIGLSAGTCSVTSFEMQQFDTTLNQGWFSVTASKPVAGSSTVAGEGYPGHTYQFRARARSAAGIVSGWTTVSTTVATSATHSHPFSGLYTLDGFRIRSAACTHWTGSEV